MVSNNLNINAIQVRTGDPIRSSNPVCNPHSTVSEKGYCDNVKFTAGILPFSTTAKIDSPNDKKMYDELSSFLDKEGKSNLEKLLNTGKLLSTNSNDKSSTLQNLYKIMTEPRTTGLDSKRILDETLRTLANPFIITQKFGKIPDFMVQEILSNSNVSNVTSGLGLNNNLAPHWQQAAFTGPSAALTEDDLNVASSGTCVAASVEFNLADKKPAEYARYVAGLTSPDIAVKNVIKYSDISPNMLEAIEILNMFGLEHKPVDWDNVEVSIKPDRNAVVRARVQSTYQKSGSRSTINSLMQSTFMQLGSANSYDSLTDKRHGGFNPDEKGLTEFEKNFAETIVDNDGGKNSITYQIVDENAGLTGYVYDFETVKKHLLDTLNSGNNIIIGITETDNSNKIIGGHEITVIGTRTARNGDLYFICNDTDDNHDGAIEIKADDLIPKIHHAGIPNKVLDLSNEPETGYLLLKEFQESRTPNMQMPVMTPQIIQQ